MPPKRKAVKGTSPPHRLRPTAAAVLRFASDQRRELKKLGVTSAQVRRLEQALPHCREVIRHRPSLTAVKEEFDKLAVALRVAAEAIAELRASASRLPPSPAASEVYWRIQLLQRGPEHAEAAALETTQRRLLADLTIAEEAIALLNEQAAQEGGQRRPRDATPIPVALIDRALQIGWWETHIQAMDVDAPRPDVASVPEYPFQMSTSPGSPFRTVVRVCYDAFTEGDYEPERAIKNYKANCNNKDDSR